MHVAATTSFARGHRATLLGAVLVLMLFVAGGVAAAMPAPVAPDRVELASERAQVPTCHAIAAEVLAAPRATALAVAAHARPRPLPRCRQVQSRGLPPPRAPTA